MILRDLYGIPDVKLASGKSISQILKEKKIGKELPDDLLALMKKSVQIRKHLEDNKKEEGIVVTESGLQYKVLKEGTGEMPKASDKVKVHYKGTLIDGKEFDSSYKRVKPTEFNCSAVIKGWTEGLQLMKEGSHYKFFIPSELAYGARGAGASIPPHAALIFEVELLEIVK